MTLLEKVKLWCGARGLWETPSPHDEDCERHDMGGYEDGFESYGEVARDDLKFTQGIWKRTGKEVWEATVALTHAAIFTPIIWTWGAVRWIFDNENMRKGVKDGRGHKE